MRRVLLAFGSLALVATLTGVTYSVFSVTTANSVNSASAGTVALTDNDGGTAMLSLAGAAPGWSSTSCITVSYSGTLDATVRLYATVTGTLGSNLNLVVTRGTTTTGFGNCKGFTPDAADHLGAGPGVVYSGVLSSFPSSYAAGTVDPKQASPERWTTGESHAYKLTVTVGTSNAAQGASASATFTWEARDIATSPAVLTTGGLAGYWRLNETSGTAAADSFGTNGGTYSGGVTLGAAGLLTNDVDKAATFDGIDDQVSAADSAALSPTAQLSVEAWVKPTDITTYRKIASKDWILRIDSPGEGNDFSFFVNIGGSYEPRVNSGFVPTVNSVYHVVGTFDGSTLRIYVNGELRNSQARSGTVVDSASSLNIGGAPYWKGTLDDVAFYNVALTAAQVQEHYAGR